MNYSSLILPTMLVCLYALVYTGVTFAHLWRKERRAEYLRRRQIARKFAHWCNRSDYENLLFEYRNK